MARGLIFLLLAALAGPAAGAAIEYAALRDGRALYWRVAEAGAPAPAAPLPAGLETPLGSVWKLFVYAYLADRGETPPDYVCGGRERDEAYCCGPGGSIGREAALQRSCGLYFAPARLGLAPAAWAGYWRGRGAPAWLTRLDAMAPATVVPVAELLRALAAVPEGARQQAGGTLLGGLVAARDPGPLRHFGGLLRAKTYSWHRPGRPGERIGGAAGWLADGSPVWLQGSGTSQAVLPRAAERLPEGLIAAEAPAGGCVSVAMFERYPLAAVLAADGRPAAPGVLNGRYRARFTNGNELAFAAAGEMRLLPGPPPRLVARLGVGEYVARVIDREAAPTPVAAARALAVAARTYLVREAHREGGCLALADSSASQRVSPSPASAAARRIALWTDGLVLSGTPVHYHRDQPARHHLAWTEAVAWAEAGAGYDDILRRVWPEAGLTTLDGPEASDCARLAEAERWLARQAPRWRPALAAEPGFEAPAAPSVCRLGQGNPYADPARGRIYVHGLRGREDRLTLAHEYLHLAFAGHPRGGDEAYVEALARRLLQEGTP